MLDYNHELSDAQTVLSTQASTNLWDAKAANAGSGVGGLRAFAVVHTLPALAGDYTATLQDSANTTTYFTVAAGPAATTGPAAGTILLDVGLPASHRRYVRFNYTVSGTLTVGQITAYLYTVR